MQHNTTKCKLLSRRAHRLFIFGAGKHNSLQQIQHSALRCNRCNTLQHTATHCNTMQHTTTLNLDMRTDCFLSGEDELDLLQHTATYYTITNCNTLQHAATHCNTLQRTATHCNTPQQTTTSNPDMHTDHFLFGAGKLGQLQHTATHCNTLQHTATHCNTLQHTATWYNLQSRHAHRSCFFSAQKGSVN